MKRFLLMIVLAVMAAGLISCGKQNEAVDPLPQNEEVEVEKDPGSQTEAQIEEPKEAPSRIELVTGRYDEAQGMPYEYATITAYRSTGDVVWTGGNKEDIDLQTGQSAANDNSYMEQYKAVLLVHPTMSSGYTTEYTLYDIDKNGIPELIVREKAVWYYIYIFDGTKVVSSEENYWSYSNCLYAYDGNGIAVHDGGMGYLHVEYVSLFSMTDNRLEWADTLMSTEECSYEDLRAFLDTLTPIDDFIPITDDSYLTN